MPPVISSSSSSSGQYTSRRFSREYYRGGGRGVVGSPTQHILSLSDLWHAGGGGKTPEHKSSTGPLGLGSHTQQGGAVLEIMAAGVHHAGPVYWDDFIFLGMFLFSLGIGWAFGRNYVTGARNIEDHKSNHVMESLFMGSWTEGALICCFVSAMVIMEINPFRFEDVVDPRKPGGTTTISAGGSRFFFWIVWLPYAVYGILRMVADSRGSAWRTGSRLCLAVAFLCQYAIIACHLSHLPPGSDRTMYTPLCTLIYLSALFVFGELCCPTSEWLRWGRFGCALVQGTWLIQVGMTICITGRDWKREEEVGITVLLIFLWHVTMCVLIFKFVKKTVTTALETRPMDSDDEYYEDDELSISMVESDDDSSEQYFVASPKKSRIGIKSFADAEFKLSKAEMMALMLSNWFAHPVTEADLMGIQYR